MIHKKGGEHSVGYGLTERFEILILRKPPLLIEVVLQLRQLLLNASFTIKCKCKVVKYCSVKNMHQSKSTIECKLKVLLNQVVITKVLLNQVVITKVNIL